MVEGAAIKDKVDTKPAVKDGSDTPHPLVSRQDIDTHQSTIAAATKAKESAPVVKDGKLDCSGDCYAPQAGAPKSAAQTGEATAAKTPEHEALTPTVSGKADKTEKPGLERAPEVNNGADAARDLPVRPGDAPPTRSDKPSYKPDDPDIKDIQPARDRLLASESSMSPEMKAAMTKHMDDLEHRLPPATAKQIAGVYDATTKLLNDPEKTSPLSQPERNRLADDILSNAAQQHEIDQGMHNTCNVTTLEQTLNRESPDKAAALVADVGLKGYYTSPTDGKRINIDPKSLHPDGETNFRGTEAKDGNRNYASQVFDMATINDYWQHQNPKGMYTQTNARDGQGDTGERLMYANGQEMRGPNGKPMREPGLDSAAMAQIGKDIGLKGDYIVSTKQFQQDNSNGEKGEQRVQSYDDFKNALMKNSTTIVALNAKDKLFTGTDDKGGSQGGHVVTVSDFRKGENGAPDEVYMRNQWGSENNKWVSVADLYNASLPPGSKDRVEPAAVANNSVPGREDHDGRGESGRQGGHGAHGGGGRGSDSQPDGPRVNRNERMMTDEEYQKWRDEIKKEDPTDKENIKHKPEVDIQALIAPLQAKLEAAKARKDDFNASLFDAQISILRNSQ
ncbi:MAG: hypothetical protein P4L53_00635 [Candidatus Obscuribacterales bacterium]|nr:hypothetical protein [Candidatus Obscuribacterales bacterium]